MDCKSDVGLAWPHQQLQAELLEGSLQAKWKAEPSAPFRFVRLSSSEPLAEQVTPHGLGWVPRLKELPPPLLHPAEPPWLCCPGQGERSAHSPLPALGWDVTSAGTPAPRRRVPPGLQRNHRG